LVDWLIRGKYPLMLVIRHRSSVIGIERSNITQRARTKVGHPSSVIGHRNREVEYNQRARIKVGHPSSVNGHRNRDLKLTEKDQHPL
jgi:hypothetical protein